MRFLFHVNGGTFHKHRTVTSNKLTIPQFDYFYEKSVRLALENLLNFFFQNLIWINPQNSFAVMWYFIGSAKTNQLQSHEVERNKNGVDALHMYI